MSGNSIAGVGHRVAGHAVSHQQETIVFQRGTVRVRRARLEDAETIARFNRQMAQETEAIELDEQRSVAGARAVVEDPGKGFYLLAEVDGQVVGQLLVTYEWSDWRNAWFWWIQSVYVVPEQRRGGVFRSLLDAVLGLAFRQGSVCGLRLYVEESNIGAQEVYRRCRFTRTSYQIWERPVGHGFDVDLSGAE